MRTRRNRDKCRIDSILAEMTAVAENSATLTSLHQQEFVSEKEDRASGIVCHGWWQW
jgi:hypothetical protein